MNHIWRGTPLVFISYRTADEPAVAYAIYREIAARFGEEAVFRDSDSLPAGEDFEPLLLDAVRGSTVLLVIIGANWAPVLLDNPKDWVLREITEALRLGIRVLPVLVGDTPKPDAEQLPEPIQGITRHQFVRVRPRYEGVDIDSLIADLVVAEPRLAAHDRGRTVRPAPVPPSAPTPVLWPTLAAAAVLSAAIGVTVSAGASITAVAALAIGGPALAWLAWRAVGAARQVATPDRLNAAGALLAAQVYQQSTDAVQDWRLDTPKVTTRWVFQPTRHTPGAVRTWTSGGAGGVAELIPWIRALPRTRLVVLGEGGAGKTSLALLLIRHLTATHQPGDRIPVLVPLTAWTPAAGSLHAWLTTWLEKDFPALRAPQFGQNAITALIGQRRLIPVLDGLDELPPDAQHEVMRVLAELSDHDAWIVTSRTETFSNLPATHHTGADATLTAQPLSPAEVRTYLARAAPDQPLTVDDHHPLIRAMRTPMTLWLLNRTYLASRADPAQLMTFTDPDAIRRHLLAHLVPSLLSDRGGSTAEVPFRPSKNWPADGAQRWLATLAEHLTMAATTELAWWALDELGPRRPRRVLATVLAVGAAVLVGGAVLATTGPAGLPIAVAFTMLFALAPVTGSARRPTPAFASFRLSGKMASLLAGLAKGAIAGTAVGGSFLLGTQASQWIAPGYMRPLSTSTALAFGIALGMVFGLFRWAGVPTALDSARTPAKVLGADRQLTVVVACTLGAVLSLLSGYVLPPTMSGTAQLAVGLATFPLWTVWTAFTTIPAGKLDRLTGHAWPGYVLTVAWAAARGRLPWRLMPFLDDMHRLGILKQVGATYQFRHTDLRDVLSER